MHKRKPGLPASPSSASPEPASQPARSNLPKPTPASGPKMAIRKDERPKWKGPGFKWILAIRGEGFTVFVKVKWVAFQAGLLWLCAMKCQTKYYSKTLPRPQQSLSSSSLVLFVQGNKTNTKAAAVGDSVLANQERSFFVQHPFSQYLMLESAAFMWENHAKALY